MKPIIFAKCNINQSYEDNSLIRKIRDRLNISMEGESFIKELDLKIAHIKFPPNFNKTSHARNIMRVQKYYKGDAILAPKTFRVLDYSYYTEFQKKIFSYSIVKSIQLILRMKNKSIKNSCIVINDAANNININIINELAKQCKYCIFLSKNVEKAIKLSDYVVANYGISPIVSVDYEYAYNQADFIICSEEVETKCKCPIWYINNMTEVSTNEIVTINDVSYNTPWDAFNIEMTPEILGAILSQMGEKDIEKSLRTNGIYIDKIKYNDVIVL